VLTRGLRLVLVVLLLTAGGGVVRADSVAGTVQATSKAARCHGLERGDVRGAEPTYTRKPLARFGNDDRLCHGIWLPRPRRFLVPQGLAISGRTAWVSGFRHRKGYGQRPCQLVKVDLVTGKRLARHNAVVGRVGGRPSTYCRHGGGILQQGKWLWLVEKSKLWLVDPSQGGNVLRAKRVWRIESPVRGSAVVANSERIGLVPFQKYGAPRIYWYSLKALRKRGVLDLGVRREGARQLGPIASTRVPRLVQGATLDWAGRLLLTRSNLDCGELVTPDRRRIAFIPGAEGIQFSADGRRLWAVSESGARPYDRPGKPLTPAVASFEWPRLLRGRPASCGFSAF
jgi:hypothetical protein